MSFCSKCGAEIPSEAAFCPNCGNSVNQSIPSQRGSVSELDNLARDRNAQEHWLYRLVAFAVDAIIVGVAVYIISLLVPLLVSRTFFSFVFFFPFIPSLGGFAGSLILVLYFIIAETYYGKTIGKGIFHLRVVMVDGSRMDIGKAFIRNISKVYWVLLLLDILVGLISNSKRGQKYSDYVANTNVIKDKVS